MNLVDTEKTALHTAFDFVKMRAEAEGAQVTWSEIVGLVPEKVLFDAAASHLQLRQFTPAQVLDRKVREAVSGGESVSGFLASVASSNPVPGGGSVAAHAGALAAALAQMVAGLTIGKKKYAAVEAEMKEAALKAVSLGNTLASLVKRDAEAYSLVSEAYKLPKEPADAAARRTEAVTSALLKAAEVPLETARASVEVARIAAARRRERKHECGDRCGRCCPAGRSGVQGRGLQCPRQRLCARGSLQRRESGQRVQTAREEGGRARGESGGASRKRP